MVRVEIGVSVAEGARPSRACMRENRRHNVVARFFNF